MECLSHHEFLTGLCYETQVRCRDLLEKRSQFEEVVRACDDWR